MSRLPIPGNDDGQWGDILNDFLSQAHASDGTLQPDSVGSTQLQASAVTATAITTGTITEDKLDTNVQVKLNTSTPIPVTTVSGRTGDITLNKNDVGLGNVDNTSDSSKPISSAVQTALNSKIDSFADPNADRVVFWDDSASAYAALALNGLTISGTSLAVDSASTSTQGKVELADNTETATGTDVTRAVTPASLRSVTGDTDKDFVTIFETGLL